MLTTTICGEQVETRLLIYGFETEKVYKLSDSEDITTTVNGVKIRHTAPIWMDDFGGTYVEQDGVIYEAVQHRDGHISCSYTKAYETV